MYPTNNPSTPSIVKTAEAATAMEQKKALVVRMRNLSSDLLNQLRLAKEEGKLDEEKKLSFARRAAVWIMARVVQGAAWAIEKLQQLVSWLGDIARVLARPAESSYNSLIDWLKREKAPLQAA